MAPRSQTLPQAATESAREARKSFFCTLCQKGYARTNDFEAHENSYDHQHRKRLKEMRQMTKDPSAAARAREAESKESGLKSISLASVSGAGSGSSTKKRPVFKSTLQPQNANVVQARPLDLDGKAGRGEDLNGAVANGWAGSEYDPVVGTEYDENFVLADLMTAEERDEAEAEARHARGRAW